MPSHTIIVRVELHKDDARTQPHPTSASEYQDLHKEMHGRGFRRYFKTAGGELLKLPPGEYDIRENGVDGDAARDIALDKAIAAATAATSADRFTILATGGGGTGGTTGYRLEKILKDPDA